MTGSDATTGRTPRPVFLAIRPGLMASELERRRVTPTTAMSGTETQGYATTNERGVMIRPDVRVR